MIYEEKTTIKKPMKVDIRFASVYPNIYKTAMSSLGYQIIYEMINEREDSWCERVIYPNTRSIESNSPIRDFNIISFSLQYEQDYFNMLEMLKKAEIPIKRKEREKESRENNKKFPLIIAGGPCATANPLPVSDFIDIFVIGEAEVILKDFLDIYKRLKNPQKEIDSFLSIKGIYIPSINNKVKKAIVEDMNNAFHVTNPITIHSEKKEDEKLYNEFLPVFGNSILLNVSRGCTRGCRFCMAGYLYRPGRETPLKKLFTTAEEARENSGLNKISLIGAAVSDYSNIDELTKGLLERGFQISTPSLRIESISKETLTSLKESGSKTITIAPESIYSLRKSINKNIFDYKIFEIIKNATDLGLNVKLYFLVGLANETKEDIDELAKFIGKIDSLKENNSIKFSINPLIPKPHTPMQWEGYDLKDIKSKIKHLKSKLSKLSKTSNLSNPKKIDIKFDSAKMGLIQYVLSCKGKEVGELLEKSIENNIPIKEWETYSNGYNLNDKLPWRNIDIGLKADFLKKEREKMLNGELTPWCAEEHCYNCGPCKKI